MSWSSTDRRPAVCCELSLARNLESVCPRPLRGSSPFLSKPCRVLLLSFVRKFVYPSGVCEIARLPMRVWLRGCYWVRCSRFAWWRVQTLPTCYWRGQRDTRGNSRSEPRWEPPVADWFSRFLRKACYSDYLAVLWDAGRHRYFFV